MEQPVEYVLERLDQWCLNRIEKHYTDEVQKEMQDHVSEHLLHPFVLPRGLGIKILEQYKREEQIEMARGYFSKTCTTLDSLLKSVSEEIPEDLMETYVNPMVREYKRLKEFISKVREKCNEVFPDELEDEYINQAFLEVFGGHEGYAEFRIAIANTMPFLATLKVKQGLLPSGSDEYVKTVYEATNKKAHYLSEKLFGDIR